MDISFVLRTQKHFVVAWPQAVLRVVAASSQGYRKTTVASAHLVFLEKLVILRIAHRIEIDIHSVYGTHKASSC
jgi:hypothetical protein